ncbi:unnamed protein product [Larinioides sclopetarius]|uniref:C2H2-type domain-containing protein n=1 Tax=Larinioides sclopetarius TaxID=280406 RepID=A0AAV2B7P7_9ARAC
MEENNWRCPRCFKHVESSVTKCPCTLNQPYQQQENKGVESYGLHQTESPLQQQEHNILKNVNRIAVKGKQDNYTNICDYGSIFQNYKHINFDNGNFSTSQESQCLPLTFHTFQENESIQSNPIYDGNFSYSQECSKIDKEPLNHQKFLPSGYFSQIPRKFPLNTKEWNDEQQTTKNLENVHDKYVYRKNLFLEKRNLNESIISNQIHSYENSGIPNKRECQPLQKQYQKQRILPRTRTIHNRQTSKQDPFQGLNDHPSDLRSSFLGESSQEQNVNADIFHFNSSDINYGRQESNYLQSTFHAEARGDYLCHNDTDRNNSDFPYQYSANEAPLPMSRHILKENIIENSSQQYQGNQNISEKINETFASQECIARFTDPVQFIHSEASFNDLCNQQSAAYSGQNIFQKDFQTKYLEDVNIKKITFTNQYPKNESFMPLNQQCLQENDRIHFTQEHQSNGMIPEDLLDTFIIGKCLSTLLDTGDCIYTQKYRIDEDVQQSRILTSINSISYPRNNTTVDLENKTDNVNEMLLDLESNASLRFKHYYENWNKCNTSSNIDGYESLSTSLNNEENIFQDYNQSLNTIQTSDISTRNSNLLINKEKYPVREPLAYCHSMNSLSIRQNLNMHHQTHSNEGTLKCNLCSKSFKRRCHLVNHMRTHSNKWKKQCIICKRSFTRKTLLDDHMRIHTKERPYKFIYKTELPTFIFTVNPKRNYISGAPGWAGFTLEFDSGFINRGYLNSIFKFKMEENNWRCPRCLKHVESSVAKCPCTLNQPYQQQENKGVDRYELHQTESPLQQQEHNILKKTNRIAVICDQYQALNDHPSDLRSPFLGESFQEQNVTEDIFHFNSTDINFGRQESNYLQKTFHAEAHGYYLCHNDTNASNSDFPYQYFANEAPLPMSRHMLNENIIENSSQQYQAPRSPFSACAPGSYICWEATDDITEPSDRVYICLRDFKMPPPIESPADSEVRAVIRFLNTKGFKAADIHRRINDVYGENIMSAGMVQKWVRVFKDSRTNIHDEERRWRSSVITDDLIQKVDSKVKENR